MEETVLMMITVLGAALLFIALLPMFGRNSSDRHNDDQL